MLEIKGWMVLPDVNHKIQQLKRSVEILHNLPFELNSNVANVLLLFYSAHSRFGGILPHYHPGPHVVQFLSCNAPKDKRLFTSDFTLEDRAE